MTRSARCGSGVSCSAGRSSRAARSRAKAGSLRPTRGPRSASTRVEAARRHLLAALLRGRRRGAGARFREGVGWNGRSPREVMGGLQGLRGHTVRAGGPDGLTCRGMPFVYLLRCADDTLYCGWTTDIDRRLAAHRSGTASRYTRSRRPVELAVVIPVANRAAALREEARIKRLPRDAKLRLIEVSRLGRERDSPLAD